MKSENKKRKRETQMKLHFSAEILVSTQLPDPIYETGCPIRGTIRLLCFKFRPQGVYNRVGLGTFHLFSNRSVPF